MASCKNITPWSNTPDTLDGLVGFVYLIVNTTTGRWYVGQKKFFSTRTKPPLKGKTRKRKVTVESDWGRYCGSSKELLNDIKRGHRFERHILCCLPSKYAMNYVETTIQLMLGASFHADSYNQMLNVRMAKPPKDLVWAELQITIENSLFQLRALVAS